MNTTKATIEKISLPPCGGSGLKCYEWEQRTGMELSPSMRREWIEMKIAIGVE